MPDPSTTTPVADDVTAVVLITGEAEALQQRCLAALEAQTLPPLRTVRVRDRSPFHAAFEAGLAESTRHCCGVDVDMVPDLDYLAVLHGAMHSGAAMSLAYLDDPMLGPEHGIKLFNVAALRASGGSAKRSASAPPTRTSAPIWTATRRSAMPSATWRCWPLPTG